VKPEKARLFKNHQSELHKTQEPKRKGYHLLKEKKLLLFFGKLIPKCNLPCHSNHDLAQLHSLLIDD